jgi:hypothetical protein
MNWKKAAVVVLVITLVYGVIYRVAQQIYRQSANDPQVALVQNGIAQMKQTKSAYSAQPGEIIDMSASASPFVAVVDPAFKLLTSNARIGINDMNIPLPPDKVFEDAKDKGERRFTWQTASGWRFATIVQYVKLESGEEYYVLAARSLSETEQRTTQLALVIGIAYLISIGAIALYLMPTRISKTQIKNAK